MSKSHLTDPFEINKKKPELTDKQKKQAAAGGAAGLVATNEARGAIQNHRVGQKGRQISTYQAKTNMMGDVKSRPRPKTGKVTQETHKPGVHQMTLKTLNQYRSKPTPNKGMDSLRSSIKGEGFKAPVHLTVYRKGGAKLWDGNHRASVADEQRIRSIPVSVTHSSKRKPIPTTMWSAKNELKHAKYRRALTRVAKSEGKMNVSAFGVDHDGADIEKAFGLSQVTSGFKAMTGAAKSGFKSGVAKPMPTKPAAMGRKMGAGTKTGLTQTKSFLGTRNGKVATGVGGAGVAGGAVVSRRNR